MSGPAIKSRLLVSGALVTALLASSLTYGLTSASAASDGFLYRDGSKLMLDGQEYKFVGVNAFGLTGCRTGSPDTEATMEAFFSSLPPKSTTRTWAFAPQGTEGIDRVIKVAEKNDQKVIFALHDGADYCNDDGHDRGFYQSGYKGEFSSWVKTVVPRYKNSPAVAMWETGNEPGHSASGVTAQEMRGFYDTTASLIKSLDPNHLVMTGSLAEYDASQSDYAYIHGGPNIDGGSLHEYDYPYNNSRTIASSHLGPTLNPLKAINKVHYVGEVGIQLNGTCISADERGKVAKAKFDSYIGAGSSGVLLWGWASNPDDGCNVYSGAAIRSGDPVMQAITTYGLPKLNESVPLELTTTTTTKAVTATPLNTGAPSTTAPVPVPATITPTSTAVDSYDDTTAFIYSGSWKAAAGEEKSGGQDHYADTALSSATIEFVGTSAQIFGAKAPHHGIATILVDGVPVANVDTYASIRSDQQLLFDTGFLTPGTHRVAVLMTGSKNPISAGAVVAIDHARYR